MTDADAIPPSAHRILDRVQNRIATIARAATVDPALQNLPTAIRKSEVPETARRYIALTIRALHDGQPLQDTDLRGAQERGSQRAEDGVPLSLVLHNWFQGAHVFLEACADASDPEDAEGFKHIALAYFRLHEKMIRTVTDAYQDEKAAIASEERGANHVLARLLVNGQDGSGEAERFGIRLAASYAVLAVSFGTATDERTGDTTGRAVAERRKLRRINRVLGQHSRFPILALLEADGGQILLPHVGADAYSDASDLVTKVTAEAHVQLTGALVDHAPCPSLPHSSELAQEMLKLVTAEERPPGIYRISDISLDYHLTRHTAATEHLLALLTPLEPFPELIETLERYYAHDLDRGPTARALHVHPNTVNNRLNRIAELLGMDPSKVDGVMKLGAALKVRKATYDS
ncbi:PucR family transcriptional regulator [Saccharopolyspora karakumensis]|uniref:PucR family transcriptional regulator n=1 Tax=Saccharopolyspora karakumensis TaxID=2530386 RepID=A0A4R5C1L3_9PSEU|nr:helix-turn-helix domain-containing protein [Saccharopolyspora karakumensis]TDD90612.1 PucR family transcriptional regulator [Saccharopolyspora karakumensis]